MITPPRRVDQGVGDNRCVVDDFSLAPGVRMRMIGLLLVGLALVVLILSGLALALSWSPRLLFGTLGLTLVAVLVLALLVVRPRWVVRLDTDGYRVRGMRSAGVRRARWSEVEDLRAVTLRGTPCLAVRLRDGRTSTLPAGLLAGGPDAVANRMREHLEGRRR